MASREIELKLRLHPRGMKLLADSGLLSRQHFQQKHFDTPISTARSIDFSSAALSCAFGARARAPFRP
jgi:hypothetical protein